ncbi:MAG: CGNR zinc finger domain-containing protein [Deltaproteobacteria bacterium]|nr:CGNR zinc finger domain-containing protein [Deltaproteobacteria bacterium]
MDSQSKPTTKMDKKTLDDFMEFVNADIQPMDKADFVRILIKYINFLGQYDDNYPFLNHMRKNSRYTEGIMEAESRESLTQRKDFLIKLQTHIRSRLQSIINSVESVTAGKADTLIDMKGSRRILIDPNKDRFLYGFWPDKVRSDDQLDIDAEKDLADLIFSDYIQNNELLPSRFGKCAWEKCEGFYYQRTAKKRIYCSTRCANAANQAKFLAKQKKKKQSK